MQSLFLHTLSYPRGPIYGVPDSCAGYTADMPNRDAILPIAIGFFFLIIAIVFLPDVIARCRRVKINAKSEFGGEEFDVIVAAILFPFRLYEALTAKQSSTNGQQQAIDGTAGPKGGDGT